jgi:hypothetical protein
VYSLRDAHPAHPGGYVHAYGSKGKRPVPNVTDESLRLMHLFRPAGVLQGTRSKHQRRCGEWPGEMRKAAASRMLVFLRVELALVRSFRQQNGVLQCIILQSISSWPLNVVTNLFGHKKLSRDTMYKPASNTTRRLGQTRLVLGLVCWQVLRSQRVAQDHHQRPWMAGVLCTSRKRTSKDQARDQGPARWPG